MRGVLSIEGRGYANPSLFLELLSGDRHQITTTRRKRFVYARALEHMRWQIPLAAKTSLNF